MNIIVWEGAGVKRQRYAFSFEPLGEVVGLIFNQKWDFTTAFAYIKAGRQKVKCIHLKS